MKETSFMKWREPQVAESDTIVLILSLSLHYSLPHSFDHIPEYRSIGMPRDTAYTPTFMWALQETALSVSHVDSSH